MELINQQQFEILTPAFIYVAVLVILGFPGNIISILVYKLQLKSTTGRDAIITLALCDIINCVMSIPVELYIMTRYYSFDNAALCKMSRYVTYSMNNASGLILIAIAFERYRTICTPHKPKLRKNCIRTACVVMVILGPLLALPSLWIYGIQTDMVSIDGTVVELVPDIFRKSNLTKFGLSANETKNDFNVTNINTFQPMNLTQTKRCLIDDSVRNTWFIYFFFGFLTIASAAVMLILVFIYSQIALKIKGLRTLASTASDISRERSAAKKKQVTFMLFLITLAFQFSFIPFVIISNIRFFTSPEWYNNQPRFGKMTYHFFLRSYLFNCAVNPFIYCISSRHFRSAVCKLHKRLKVLSETCIVCRNHTDNTNRTGQ